MAFESTIRENQKMLVEHARNRVELRERHQQLLHRRQEIRNQLARLTAIQEMIEDSLEFLKNNREGTPLALSGRRS